MYDYIITEILIPALIKALSYVFYDVIYDYLDRKINKSVEIKKKIMYNIDA